MSLIDGARSITISDFKGCMDYGDTLDVPVGNAVRADNCEFSPGSVKARRGLGSAFATTVAIQSTHHWTQGLSGAPKQFFTYLHSGATLVNRDLSTGTETTIGTLGASLVGAVFAQSGKRLIIAGLSSTGAEYAGAKVWDGSTASALDDCFQRPLLTTEVTISATEPSVGSVTVGDHYIGAIFQTRTGYWTRPGPAANVAGLTLTPYKFTSGGSKNISIVFTPSTVWPAWITALQLIITPALNNFQYYLVPGTITSVTAGGAGAVTVTFDLGDIQLRAIGSQGAGTLADDYFNLVSIDNANTAPFKVKFVCPWGQRMVYVGNVAGTDSLLVSEQQNHQWISFNEHLLQLPGGMPISACFEIRGVLYVVSPSGFVFSFYDNGGRPVSFSPPQEVDGRVGGNATFAVSARSASGYAVVASPQGLYVFTGGSFPQIPLSYKFNNIWKLIDWTSPWNIIVKDNPQDRMFYVKVVFTSYVCNGGQTYTSKSFLITVDYSLGMTPDTVNMSVWIIGNPATYPLGPIELVRNYTKNLWELYVAPNGTSVSETFNVGRQRSTPAGDLDNVLFYDTLSSVGSTPTTARYKTAYLPQKNSRLLKHVAIRMRVKPTITGDTTAVLSGTITTLDDVLTVGGLTQLSGATFVGGQWYLNYYDAEAESVGYDFTMVGCVMSEFMHYYFPLTEQR